MWQPCGLLIVFILQATLCQSSPVRFCVSRDEVPLCQDMERDNPGSILCAPARDRMACIRKVSEGEADVVHLSAEDMYPAGKYHDLQPLLMEVHREAYETYTGLIVVRKAAQINSLRDMKGKKSCHTAFGRTYGWNVPLGIMLAEGVIEADCEGLLPSVSKFFSQSCIPGNWSSDRTVDAYLKSRYSNLCALCGNPERCSQENEPYFGYDGSLRCLTQGGGDLTFTKIDALREYLEENPDMKSDFEIMCLDGSKQPLDTELPCELSYRPTSTYMYKPKLQQENRETLARTLKEIYARHNSERPEWFNKIFVSKPQRTIGLSEPPAEKATWERYLGNYKQSVELDLPGCEPKTVRMCVTRGPEMDKCIDFKRMAYAHRIRPEISCIGVEQKSDCVNHLHQREADFVTLDGGDLYHGGRYYNLKPVAGERYGESELTYYAVAVIRKDANINSLSDLQGKRSCHTGIGRTAGWKMPIGKLASLGLIQDTNCDRIQGTSEFFAQSCLPGAKDPRYNNNTEAGEKLCSLCIGDENGEHKCQRSAKERYGGYAGAFRCLAEGAGDVAFINHRTVSQNTDGKNHAQWARNLKSEDYRLLCAKGGVATVDQYEECNIAEVPTHYVATSVTSEDDRMAIVHVLVSASKHFGPSSKSFHVFGPNYKGVTNLLFKDDTTALIPVSSDKTYRDVLGELYVQVAEQLDQQACTRPN